MNEDVNFKALRAQHFINLISIQKEAFSGQQKVIGEVQDTKSSEFPDFFLGDDFRESTTILRKKIQVQTPCFASSQN